ncbi:hypothetical protein V8C26DRAFT_406161 [Trichoderma gracile]
MRLDARLPRQSDVLSASKAHLVSCKGTLPGQRPENQENRWGSQTGVHVQGMNLLGANITRNKPCCRRISIHPLPLATSAVEVHVLELAGWKTSPWMSSRNPKIRANLGQAAPAVDLCSIPGSVSPC